MNFPNPFAAIGRQTIRAAEEAGSITLFFTSFLAQVPRWPFHVRLFFNQCEKLGVGSLPIVLLTALFTGAVLALQTYRGFNNATIAESTVGTVVALSMIRELGPVLASLMVAGRVGAAIAAEIGTMRVTEQIDALVTLATNPIKYLVVPRVMACLIMVPMLVTLADVVGIFGGYLAATNVLGLSRGGYFERSFATVGFHDIGLGLIKAAVFGLIIGLMGCYHGYHTRGGAEGVGKSTTAAVVFSSVLILIADYFITALMMEHLS